MSDAREMMWDRMTDLVRYVRENTDVGVCKCGKCVDAPEHPEQHQPTGHTVDMIFFEVSAKPTADAKKLRELVEACPIGEFTNVNLFDGAEHGYMELGGWLGSRKMVGMGLLCVQAVQEQAPKVEVDNVAVSGTN